MHAQSISRTQRREEVLYVVGDEGARPASFIAYCLNYSRQAVRSDLGWLKEHGFVKNFMFDERGHDPTGRLRTYWEITEKGRAYLADHADGAGS